MKTNYKPAGHTYTILKQICNLIPGHLVSNLAKKHGIDRQSRTFTPWSHVVSLMYAQLTHAIGLNDTCDALRMNAGVLSTIRGAHPPSRNNLSHANKIRSSAMAEELYWAVMDHLININPAFGKGKVRRGYLRRFRKIIHAIDSTTLQLVAKCLDWAKHRRRKAGAKVHMRLNLQSFLPRMAVVSPAGQHDVVHARTLCDGLREGEIVVFDMAYLGLSHLHELHQRGVWWVSRAKRNMQWRVVKRLHTTDDPRVLSDERIEWHGEKSRERYPASFRRIVAEVEIEGKKVTMTFLTNNVTWSAWTIAELYRCRWDIEVFFKEIKQTLQLADFLGHNANAVQWQIWMGLLVHLLLRFLAFTQSWPHSFTRIFTITRAVLWRRWNLHLLLHDYGTARPPGRIRATPEMAYLPGFG